jgi:hypothetical protein
MSDERASNRLVRKVEAVVSIIPLWNLQTVGKEKLDFLFGDSDQNGNIELRPGIAYCFRKFHPLIQDVVRSACLRDVRSLNSDLLARRWTCASSCSGPREMRSERSGRC